MSSSSEGAPLRRNILRIAKAPDSLKKCPSCGCFCQNCACVDGPAGYCTACHCADPSRLPPIS